MGMSRSDATAYIGDVMATTLGRAGITPDSFGLATVIDDALLLMGVGYDDLASAVVDSANVIAYRAVLAYVALEKAYDAVLTFVDSTKSLGAPSVSKSERLSQMVAAVAARLALARDKASAYVTVSETNSWEAPGRLDLDTYNKPYLGDLGTGLGGSVGGWPVWE